MSEQPQEKDFVKPEHGSQEFEFALHCVIQMSPTLAKYDGESLH